MILSHYKPLKDLDNLRLLCISVFETSQDEDIWFAKEFVLYTTLSKIFKVIINGKLKNFIRKKM